LAIILSQLDDAFSRAEALSAKILPESMTPPVNESMWKRSKEEIKHKTMRALAAFSGPSTASRKEISSANALYQISTHTPLVQTRVGRVDTDASKAQKHAAQTRQRNSHKTDLAYGTKHDLPRAGPDDSPEKIEEKQHIQEVARRVHDVTTHLKGKDHLVWLVREQQLPELDRSNSDMKKCHELTSGGIKAPLAIHNVGGNPSYFRSDAVIECAMLHRILTGIAIMVCVPRLRLTALCCCGPCIVCNIHSFGVQFWNPQLELLVLTELPNSAASKVRVCLRMRICVNPERRE